MSLLARVILPRPGEPLDVRKLYIEESETNARRAHAATRTTLEIGEESEVSFATYFNAFPASYWRRWSTLTSVVLRVELTGSARVDVYRSKATGARISVGGTEIVSEGSAPAAAEFEVELEPFEDGGWIWFDITTDSRTTVHDAAWYAPVPAPGRTNVAVGIPTFNRPADCVNALRALTSDPLVNKVIGAVIVVDQGADKAVDHPDFPAAAAGLSGRLSIHNQPNLGGSGGYSRVMYEALKNTDCQQILFMDDDIRIEPDSILRALALSRFAKSPMLVGGQMLNLQEPLALARDGRGGEPRQLHVDQRPVHRSTTMTSPNTPRCRECQGRRGRPQQAASSAYRRRLQRLVDVPDPEAGRRGTRPTAPLFIKWDDADYGLRAGEHGYPTVTMPGTAIWHMAWSDKDDAIDWQAYFHLRNRLVVSALHWDAPVNGLLKSSIKATLKHLLCLEYSTVAIQNRAIADFSPVRTTSSRFSSRRCRGACDA